MGHSVYPMAIASKHDLHLMTGVDHLLISVSFGGMRAIWTVVGVPLCCVRHAASSSATFAGVARLPFHLGGSRVRQVLLESYTTVTFQFAESVTLAVLHKVATKSIDEAGMRESHRHIPLLGTTLAFSQQLAAFKTTTAQLLVVRGGALRNIFPTLRAPSPRGSYGPKMVP